MTSTDYFALVFFIATWAFFNWLTSVDRTTSRISITRAMAVHRARWIRNSMTRDLKMIDTQIMAGLQNGTGFFASTSLFALGGCFALLGATEQVEAIFRDLPIMLQGGRQGFEIKVGGLAVIFAYSFFKFGWSYRLFNYCTILFGGLPMHGESLKDPDSAQKAADRVIRLNIIAAKHFNAGLRAIFLSIGYLGWFVNAYVFMSMTVFVFFVLIRRQFFSEAREAILRDIEE
ncbi:MAG: DUF599 family protein [Rhizobium sp.]|jgi:uncharacterized membrane protein|nr:DUF599 family protein [Rhizobium sp.]